MFYLSIPGQTHFVCVCRPSFFFSYGLAYLLDQIIHFEFRTMSQLLDLKDIFHCLAVTVGRAILSVSVYYSLNQVFQNHSLLATCSLDLGETRLSSPLLATYSGVVDCYCRGGSYE